MFRVNVSVSKDTLNFVANVENNVDTMKLIMEMGFVFVRRVSIGKMEYVFLKYHVHLSVKESVMINANVLRDINYMVSIV